MMDWGLSAAIIALVAFIVNSMTDRNVKKLSARVKELENKLSPPHEVKVEVCDD